MLPSRDIQKGELNTSIQQNDNKTKRFFGVWLMSAKLNIEVRRVVS